MDASMAHARGAPLIKNIPESRHGNLELVIAWQSSRPRRSPLRER